MALFNDVYLGFPLFHHELIDLSEELIRIVGMSNESDGRERIKSEDSHYGLCIYDISSLLKIHFIIEKRYLVYELSYVRNRSERNIYLLHNSEYLLFY